MNVFYNKYFTLGKAGCSRRSSSSTSWTILTRIWRFCLPVVSLRLSLFCCSDLVKFCLFMLVYERITSRDRVTDSFWNTRFWRAVLVKKWTWPPTSKRYSTYLMMNPITKLVPARPNVKCNILVSLSPDDVGRETPTFLPPVTLYHQITTRLLSIRLFLPAK